MGRPSRPTCASSRAASARRTTTARWSWSRESPVVPLVLDEALEADIGSVSRTIADRLGRPYADFTHGVRKQATRPEGAISLGLAGTAPGLVLDLDKRVVVVLPGPPRELQRLWPRALETEPVRRILARAPAREHRVLRFFGTPESAVAEALAEAGGEGQGVDVTICAREFEIHVDVFVEPGAEQRADEVDGALRRALGRYLFGEDERSVAEIVLELCRARGLTLGTAESCTGGMVAGRLTAVAGASEVFRGSVVAYADDVKESVLGVPTAVLQEHGAVSAEAAASMAHGVRERLGVDVGVAVTGVAGTGRRFTREAGRARVRARGRARRGEGRPHGTARRPRHDPRARDCSLAPPRPAVVGESAHLGVSSPATVGEHDRIRLFLALEVPEEVVDELRAWSTRHLTSGRPVESFHVTLAFLGGQPPRVLPSILDELRRETTATEPFSLEPARYRETRSVGMLVLADPSGRATSLAERLQTSLERLGLYAPERRPWLPHITVVRFRERPKLSPPIPSIGPFAPSGAAAFLSRLHPSGARYEVLESCSLNRESGG